MKYFAFILVFGLTPGSLNQAEVIKKYYGGRNGYWYHSLKLYDNYGYSYTKWIHTRYSLRDTGNYELTGKEIRLTSISTEVEQGGLDKKTKKRFDEGHKNYKHFDSKSFRVDNDKIYLSDLSELINAEDSIKFGMGILHEIPKDKK